MSSAPVWDSVVERGGLPGITLQKRKLSVLAASGYQVWLQVAVRAGYRISCQDWLQAVVWSGGQDCRLQVEQQVVGLHLSLCCWDSVVT